MCFLNFKKSKLERHGTERIIHLLTCHQHGKNVNTGVKPSACYSSRHVPQFDTENRGREKCIWHAYMIVCPKYIFTWAISLASPSFELVSIDAKEHSQMKKC